MLRLDGARSADPLGAPPAPAGDRIGVVLLVGGGPDGPRAVPAYVEALLADPRRCRRPLPRALCRALARFFARRRAADLARRLRAVGGEAPDARQAGELAAALATELGAMGAACPCRVYVAARYGGPTPADALAAMRADGVTRLVVVPLLARWLDGVSGSYVAAWRAAQEAAGFGVPTAVVTGFDEQPGYVQAHRERIAEALQRFGRAVRDDVHLLFALHPAARYEGATPEATPLGRIVARVAEAGRAVRVAYGRAWGLSLQAAPGVDDALEALVREGARAVLVVPVGYVHDTLDTAYELDVALRQRAGALGLLHFEVASPLGVHALFVGALAAAVRGALHLPAAPAPRAATAS